MYIVTDKKNITRIDIQNKNVSVSVYCFNTKCGNKLSHGENKDYDMLKTYGISVAIYDYKTKTFWYITRYWKQLQHLIKYFTEKSNVQIHMIDTAHFDDYENKLLNNGG